MGIVNKNDVVEFLTELPMAEMVAVCESVFTARTPFPGEPGEDRFCLAISSRRQQTCQLEAVAYVNREKYQLTNGPDFGLCQSGTCVCGITLRSNVKHARCPACAANVYLT